MIVYLLEYLLYVPTLLPSLVPTTLPIVNLENHWLYHSTKKVRTVLSKVL